jgi:pimeloyl-ACP methyl ester carboxylesterase
MIDALDALWLNTSPSLHYLNQPLLKYLAQSVVIANWEYQQTQDEACSLQIAVTLLHDYLKHRDRPIHLIGHGMSGVASLIYARQFPARVRSLTLLSVASQPAITWHAHYYVQRQLFACSRRRLLTHTIFNLFGNTVPQPEDRLLKALNCDLDRSLGLHSLFKIAQLPHGGVSMPLLICGGETDSIVCPPDIETWHHWLKPEDALWQCPDGRHFFHYFHPQLVGDRILEFWRSALINRSIQHQISDQSDCSTIVNSRH